MAFPPPLLIHMTAAHHRWLRTKYNPINSGKSATSPLGCENWFRVIGGLKELDYGVGLINPWRFGVNIYHPYKRTLWQFLSSTVPPPSFFDSSSLSGRKTCLWYKRKPNQLNPDGDIPKFHQCQIASSPLRKWYTNSSITELAPRDVYVFWTLC